MENNSKKKQKTLTTKILLGSRKWEVPMPTTALVAYLMEGMEDMETPFIVIPVTSREVNIMLHKSKVEDIIMVNPQLPNGEEE